jgi:hypothetical protein
LTVHSVGNFIIPTDESDELPYFSILLKPATRLCKKKGVNVENFWFIGS